MSAIDNPYLRLYDAFYKLMFEGDDNKLGAFVKVGNRVTFGTLKQDDRNPFKQSVTTADIPEIVLIDEGGFLNIHGNSSGAKQQYNLVMYISTGDWRYSCYIAPIGWYITCNLNKWLQGIRDEVTWNGTNFVKNVLPTPIQIGESNPERNRMLDGWTAIWRFQFELFFPTGTITYSEGD